MKINLKIVLVSSLMLAASPFANGMMMDADINDSNANNAGYAGYVVSAVSSLCVLPVSMGLSDAESQQAESDYDDCIAKQNKSATDLI